MTLIILFAGVALAFGLPPVYRSSATILIEQQEIPQELVRSTVTSYADQRIQVISQRVMTRANLLDIIRKYDLYKDERNKHPLEVVLEQMREDIQMKTVSADVVDPRSGRPTIATIAFTLTYYNETADLAQKVANELTSLYLNENLTSRRQQASEAAEFLGLEADKLRARIDELEQQLAQFKERNASRLPELTQMNLQLLDRTETQLLEVERQLRAVEERRIYLRSSLAQTDPSPTIYAESGERVPSAAARLKALQTTYISKAATYAADHPDLIKMRKQIAALEQETGAGDAYAQLLNQRDLQQQELTEALQTYGTDHPTVRQLQNGLARLDGEVSQHVVSDNSNASVAGRSENPAYLQLQAQLEAADADYRALIQKEKDLLKKKRVFETDLTGTPQVEREYTALLRDHDHALQKYREINAKTMEAQLAQVLETERKGERFTLIEPPQMPEEPDRPNRLAVLFLGAVFSLVGGTATIAVSHAMDRSVRGARALQALLGAAPLAVIPALETADQLRRRRRRRWLVAVSLSFVLVIMAGFFHWLVLPLDILWFSGLRRLGLH